MATIQDRTYSDEYSGLLSNIYVSISVAAVCSIGYEAFRHTRRRRGDPRKAKQPRDDNSRESWEFGYLYSGRSWSRTPSPLLSKWPFAWAWAAIWFPEGDMPARVGVDATVHVRYLRACWYYILLHTLTTLPILLPIHIHYSPDNISRTSMLKASLSSLILTTAGKVYLPVHFIILMWLMATWVASLVWLAWGSIRYRRSSLHHTFDLAMKAAAITPLAPHPSSSSPTSQPLLLPPVPEQITKEPDHDPYAPSRHHPLEYDEQDGPQPATNLTSSATLNAHTIYTPDQKPITNEGPRGWRQRTIQVTNIPPGMRSEETLRAYFEDGCNRYGILGDKKHSGQDLIGGTTGAGAVTVVEDEEDAEEAFITEIVVVRRMLELERLRERRMDVLQKLEIAHITLVTKVMAAVKREGARRQERARLANGGRTGVLGKVEKLVGRNTAGKSGASEAAEEGGVVGDLEKGKMRRGPCASSEKEFPAKTEGPHRQGTGGSKTGAKHEDWRHLDVDEMTKREKRDILFTALGRFLDETNVDPNATDDRTIWEVLHALPRALLDPYQPLTHLTSLFRNQNAPLIDYLSAKLNLLTSLIEEQTSRPVSSFAPSSTAFVTFRNPKIARLVQKRMESHPRKRLACDVQPAPDFRDLDWVRLMRNTYRVEFVRSWVVALGVWAFTVVWVIPITFFVSLTSISNLASIIPSLENYLNTHPTTARTLGSLIPTLLVSILTLLIPLILLIISKQAETITTKSELHNVIGNRFYRFLICNVVIFFCIGKTALQSFIISFRDTLSLKLLEVIASSFPQAAPFYAGWLILQTSLTSGFENFMFGLPLIFYLGIRASKVPRQRDQGLEPRFWNYFYWCPVHTVTLGIVVLFAVLNPLVIPFGLIYFCAAYPVFKNQLLHVYQHQYETQGTRVTIRFLRYTLDGHVLAQIVFLAMMVILKEKALIGLTVVLIVCTLVIKVLLTRAVKSRFAALALEESDGLYAISRGRAPALRRSPSQAIQDQPSPDPQAEGTSTDSHGIPEITHPTPAASGRFATWRARAGEGFHLRGFNYNSVPRRRNSVSLLPLRRKPVPAYDEGGEETASLSSSSPFISVPSRLIAPLLARFDQRWEKSALNLHDPEEPRSPGEVDGEGRPIPEPMEELVGEERERKERGKSEGPAGGGEEQEEEERREVPLVQPRKSPMPWDDTPHDGRRYGFQPAYVDPLPMALWLPRHPLRTLDLEDTLELSRSLETSLGGSGRIGSWGAQDESYIEEEDEDGVLVEDDYLTAGDRIHAGMPESSDVVGGVLRDSPGEIVRSSSNASRASPRRSPGLHRLNSKASTGSLARHPRLNGTERINLAPLMADPESGSDNDDDSPPSPSAGRGLPASTSAPAHSSSHPPSPNRLSHQQQHQQNTLSRSKTSILARPRPAGPRGLGSPNAAGAAASSPRRHISIAQSHHSHSHSHGGRVASIFRSPSSRHPPNSLSPPMEDGGESGGRPGQGRGRSDSAVSVKDAVMEEIMKEEREARARERKEERELTEKEGSRLARGGSLMKRMGFSKGNNSSRGDWTFNVA